MSEEPEFQIDPNLTNLLSRLDQLSSQFQDLGEGIRQAITIADLDPEMSLTRARKVLEFIVRDVYEKNIEPAGTRPLENLLQRLSKDGHMPRRIVAYANAVRELGNVGTHVHGEPITKSDVTQSLQQLMFIVEWYFELSQAKDGASAAKELTAKSKTSQSPAKVTTRSASVSATPGRVQTQKDEGPVLGVKGVVAVVVGAIVGLALLIVVVIAWGPWRSTNSTANTSGQANVSPSNTTAASPSSSTQSSVATSSNSDPPSALATNSTASQSTNQGTSPTTNPTSSQTTSKTSSPSSNQTSSPAIPTRVENAHTVAGADIRDGLLYYWPFDETDDDVAHDIQGSNHGSLSNWRSDRPRWVSGKIGQALQFADAENAVMTSKTMDAQRFTISFWLQVQQEKGTNPRVIHPWAALNYEHGKGIGVLGEVIEPTKPNPGQWYHYAIVIDLINQSATIYRGGVQVAQDRLSIKADEGPLVLGHNQDPGNHGDTLNGLIDEVRVYGRTLSAEEIGQLAAWNG